MIPGTGTFVNAIAIIIGGVTGLIFKKKLSKNICGTLMQALGATILFIGAGGVIKGLLSVNGSKLEMQNSLFLIFSLVSGTVIGELLGIKKRTEDFGSYLSRKSGSSGDSGFIGSFVSASLTVCIGAMAIIGSIEDGMNGNPDTLFAKSLLDGFIIMIFASVTGKGAVFSAIPVLVFQGTVTVTALFASPIFNASVISNMSFVGSVLIFCVGVNIMFGKDINVANMLPSVFTAIPLTYFFSMIRI